MTIRKAKDIFREFHSKEPNKIIKLKTKIPKKLYPIGYGVQISYRSDKWNNEEKFLDYIHWWENPTLVCVPIKMVDEIVDPRNRSVVGSPIYIGPRRNEVTYLGYAIDFSISNEDKSYIQLGNEFDFTETFDSDDLENIEKLDNTITFEFDATPGESKNFVVSSPNGRIVYVINDDDNELFAFINTQCRITKHGIIG